MQLRRIGGQHGFSLIELSVVFTIVVFLMGSGLFTLGAFLEQRKTDETRNRLNAAVDALLGFAVVNKRLPCPAVANATGVEVFAAGICTNSYSGYLPGTTIGYMPVDANGYGIDAYGGQIHYAVATGAAVALTGCSGTSTLPHLVNSTNLKSNGISCKPGNGDLDVCITSSGTNATSCNTATRVAAQNTVAFIVWSQGKNWNDTASWSADETENNDNDPVFVNRPFAQVATAQGSFDDMLVYVPIGVLYQKLINAGVLP